MKPKPETQPKPLSKRAQKRLEAAEEVCRAFRQAIACYSTQQHYMDIALQWLIVWRDNAPLKVWASDAKIPKKKKK